MTQPIAADPVTEACAEPHDGEAAALHKLRQRHIARGLTDVLFHNLPMGLIGTVLISGLLAIGLAGTTNSLNLMVWYGLIVSVCAGRYILCRAYAKANPDDTAVWLRRFEAGALLSGMAWGTASVLIFPDNSLTHQMFMGFVLASMAAGAVSTLATHLRSYAFYLLPGILPYTGKLLLQGSDLHVLMAVVFVFGLVVLLVSAKRFHKLTVDALTLQFDNERLVSALRSALRSAEEASSAKSAFLANMSHEIRTPMNAVLGMADLLLKTQLSERQQRLTTTLSHSAKGLLAIINDILDVSRIEAGKLSLEKQTFALRELIEETVELCSEASYRKGLEISLIADETLPAAVQGDAVRLRQVLVNIIGNAVKFTQAGHVAIRARARTTARGRAEVAIEISDSGIGIAPEAQERLFKPFSQADSSISRRFGGTGLGLAIAQHLVTMMEGSLRIASSPGEGTTVSVELPLDVATATLTPGIPSLAGRRILIVDDRPLNREMLATHLAGTSATISFASTNSEALAALIAAQQAGAPIDMAVFDRVAPHTGSREAVRAIRADDRLAGTYLIACLPMGRGDAESEIAGSDCVLTKPVRRADLLAAITGDANTQILRNIVVPALAQPARAPLPTCRVLLAEDNPVNQEVALEYLRDMTNSVRLANNGREALAAFQDGTFDVILMDFQMPEMDGLRAAQAIRALEHERGLARTPIIALTANAYDSDRTLALQAGMDDYLAKPYSEEQLARMLRKWSPKSMAVAAA